MIAVSNATAKRVIGILPVGKRVQTIYNGVDLDRFSARRAGGWNSEKRSVSQKEIFWCVQLDRFAPERVFSN